MICTELKPVKSSGARESDCSRSRREEERKSIAFHIGKIQAAWQAAPRSTTSQGRVELQRYKAREGFSYRAMKPSHALESMSAFLASVELTKTESPLRMRVRKSKSTSESESNIVMRWGDGKLSCNVLALY